jgi:hypothetical protein
MASIRSRLIKEILSELELDCSDEIVDKIIENTYHIHLHELYEEIIEQNYYIIKNK